MDWWTLEKVFTGRSLGRELVLTGRFNIGKYGKRKWKQRKAKS